MVSLSNKDAELALTLLKQMRKQVMDTLEKPEFGLEQAIAAGQYEILTALTQNLSYQLFGEDE